MPSRGPYWGRTTGGEAIGVTAIGSGAGGGAGVVGTTVVTAGTGGGGAAFSSAAIASRSIVGCTANWWLITEYSGSPSSSSRTRRIS